MKSIKWVKTKFLDKRADYLIKNDRYIETVFLFAAILEHQLKCILSIYEDMIRKSMRENKLFFQIDITNKERMTLGKLKEYLSVYCKKRKLIKEIERFINLRN